MVLYEVNPYDRLTPVNTAYISCGSLRTSCSRDPAPVFAIRASTLRSGRRKTDVHRTSCAALLAHTGCPAICLSICACKHAHLLSRMAGAYIVNIIDRAAGQFDSIISYIHYTLRNPQAAENLWLDFNKTVSRLAYLPKSCRLCSHPDLNRLGYRIISLSHHRYNIIFHIKGTTVFIDAVYHQLQDYENIFATEIKK